MSDKSRIEWTDATWNPVTGCTKVSPGCDHCYAERFAERWRGIKGHPYEQGFDLRLWPDRLTQPGSWTRPRRIFVNSMSDLFHHDVPEAFIRDVFFEMVRTPRHIFQVLTKRPDRMRRLWNHYRADLMDIGILKMPGINHIWLGTSIENNDYAWRAEMLRDTLAAVRFLSIEPMLGPVDKVSLTGIHWVICGGESGPDARPMELEWVRELRDRCVAGGSPFFFKQWGGVHKKAAGRELDGRTWDQYPAASWRDAMELVQRMRTFGARM